MIALLAAHTGIHAGHAAPVALLPQIFRRAIAAVLRKEAAPEVQTPAPGAAATARFDCCGHCLTGSPCEPRDNHPMRCSVGCNDPRPYDERHCAVPSAHGRTDPYYCTLPAHHYGDPVPGGKKLAEVRAGYDPASTAELAALREPGPPGGVPVRRVRFRRPDGEIVIDERHRVHVRPVNGRSLPDQPRQSPVYGERCQLDVERDMALAAGERARQGYVPASPRLLGQVLAGLRKL